MNYVIVLASFIFCMVIIGTLTVLVFRQKGSYLKPVKITLIGANLAFEVVLFSWFIYYLVPSETLATYMIKISVTSVLFLIGAIAWAAMLLHLGPKSGSLKSSYVDLLSLKRYFLPFSIYWTYSIVTAFLTWFSAPFYMVANYPWNGGKISYVPVWTDWYQTLLFVNIVSVEVYPCSFAFLASRRYKSKMQAQTILSLTVCLAFIICFLISAMMLLPLGLEWIGLLACVLPLAIVAYYFKEATILERFFGEKPPASRVNCSIKTFSEFLGLGYREITGRKILVEFDPAANYERAIQLFVTEALANGESVALFTRNGSALHSSLREQKAVKLFCLTDHVSSPKAVSENEMLLPSSDTSMMLGSLYKAVNVHPDEPISVVFDNLSDMVFSTNAEKNLSIREERS